MRAFPQSDEQRGQRSDPHGTIEHHPTGAFTAEAVDPRDCTADGRVAEYRDWPALRKFPQSDVEIAQP